ncbi:MAG TPA: hypothetical protein VGP26_21695 [Actinophytocola sp.]|nr:hypothetical protein [Actinophytocola sp.]
MPLATAGETTVALAVGPAEFRRPGGGFSRFARELAGALAVGLSVLAIVVLVFQILAWIRGLPGPGTTMVGGHLGAAVLAVLVQRVADRNSGWPAGLAAVAVVAITAVTMWLLWWS